MWTGRGQSSEPRQTTTSLRTVRTLIGSGYSDHSCRHRRFIRAYALQITTTLRNWNKLVACIWNKAARRTDAHDERNSLTVIGRNMILFTSSRASRLSTDLINGVSSFHMDFEPHTSLTSILEYTTSRRQLHAARCRRQKGDWAK
jgi:hypothetical protein